MTVRTKYADLLTHLLCIETYNVIDTVIITLWDAMAIIDIVILAHVIQ